MDIKKSALAAVAAVTLSVGAAQAATTFEFDTADTNVTSLALSLDGITATVTPGCSDFIASVVSCEITREADGLGVYTDRKKKLFDDTDGDVDGQGGVEWLTFIFDAPVKLGQIIFGDADGNDDWDIWVDGTKIANDVDNNPFEFNWVEATTLKVGADGLNDSWRVSSLTVAPIPLPAGGVLLLTALGGLGLAARSRRG